MRIPYIRFCAMITAALLLANLTGCAPSSKEMVSLITQGQTISIEVTAPTAYQITAPKGTAIQNADWVQLDQIRNDLSGFRQAFDDVFYINKVTEGDQHGKSGCLYVGPNDTRNGNSTLQDACLNKAFHDTYWDNQVKNTKTDLAATSLKAYTDLTGTGEDSLYAAFNAYYGLLNDSENPSEFNGTQSVSREQFMAALYKASNPVDDTLTASDTYLTEIANNEYSRFTSQIESHAFLNLSNKGLRSHESGKITRAEALYLLMNYIFPTELSAINPKDYKDVKFQDAKNAGDLALTLKFKTKSKDDQGETIILSTDRWESYTLAYMTTHPDDGLQEELYASLLLANQLGLVSTTEPTRWDEPLSKTEAIKFIFQSYMAKAKLHGYATEKEHGTMVKTEPTTDNNLGTSKDGLGTEANAKKMTEYFFKLDGITDLSDVKQGRYDAMKFASIAPDYFWTKNPNMPKILYKYPINTVVFNYVHPAIGGESLRAIKTDKEIAEMVNTVRRMAAVYENYSYTDVETYKNNCLYYEAPTLSYEETGIQKGIENIINSKKTREGVFITDESLIYVAIDDSIRVRGISLGRVTQNGVTTGWEYQYKEYSISPLTEIATETKLVSSYEYEGVVWRGTDKPRILSGPKEMSGAGRAENGATTQKFLVKMVDDASKGDRQTTSTCSYCGESLTVNHSTTYTRDYPANITIKTYRGVAKPTGSETSTSNFILPMLISNNTTYHASGRMIQSSTPVTFYPTIRMTWQNVSQYGSKNDASVRSEQLSTIIPNNYAEAGGARTSP